VISPYKNVKTTFQEESKKGTSLIDPSPLNPWKSGFDLANTVRFSVESFLEVLKIEIYTPIPDFH